MNKAFKVLSFVLVLCVALSVLCVNVFAEDDYVNIINNRFSVNIPDDYIMVDNTTQFYYFVEVESADFACEDYLNTVEIRAYSNDEFTPDNINVMTDEQLEFFGKYHLKPADGGVCEGINGEYKNVKVQRSKMNGCACVTVDADYVFENLVFSHFNIVVFTAETMIYAIYFESPENDFDREDMELILSSFSMNSKHFDGDKEIYSADFSNALPYKEAHDKALDEYGYFGSYGDEYDFDGEDAIFEGLFIGVFVFISIFTGAVPLIIIIFTAVDLVKKKKKLREYEAQFGNINF